MRTFSLRVPLAAWLALLAGSSSAVAQTTVDQYGGVMRSVGPAAGFFRVKQVGDRWLFVTPDGNGMWMTGTFGVTYAEAVDDLGTSTVDRIAAKYGGGSGWFNKWRINTALRLKGWGFNTLAEYQHWGMRPGPLYDPNPEKLPYIHIIKPAAYGLDNRYNSAPGPFKDLIVGTDARYYDGYRAAQSPDFFDPNFESYVDGWMRRDDGLNYGDNGNAWMLGIAMDDTDNLFGFGPGPEIPAPRLHPHLGWIALVTNFQQASSPWVSSYADRKVYTKYALRDFLAGRYGTVSALNAAWGSGYTTFDSAGGWGAGTGLLDENGRNAWVGRWNDEMATASAALRADLNDFLYQYAKRYFTVMAAKMRQYAPKHLVFGPASLNGWAGLTRKEILRAAGESVDVLQAAIGSQEALELTAKYAGNKPIVTWDSFVANPDSALWRYSNPEDIAGGTRLAGQQQERGRLYADKVDFLFSAVTSAGVHPVAGIKLWSWTDNWWEKANFGLVSLSDNAYDGREAVRAAGTDRSGWPTGHEEADYGDFLTPAAAAHARVAQSLSGGVSKSSPAMYVDGPANGALVSSTLGVTGWAFDTGAATGPGVDLVRIFQGSACSGTVLADATLGGSRPDVQSALGLPAGFGTTGFAASITMSNGGAQQITVCARSMVTGAFSTSVTRSLSVSGARMNIDGPASGAVVPRTVGIGGWAFDLAAVTGPGVDLVRIFQGALCSGTVLTDATLSGTRPDVQAVLGLPASFGSTGFSANVTLPGGGLQQITVCAHSAVTGGFTVAVTRSLTVSSARMNIDVPALGAMAGRPLTMSGWAFDAGATTGPGVDLVRIFAGGTCSGTALADATLAIPRPDVRAAFALPASFDRTGYSASVTPPGVGLQTLTVCARSTATGTFTQSMSRTVIIAN
jgi:hypothetical protein